MSFIHTGGTGNAFLNEDRQYQIMFKHFKPYSRAGNITVEVLQLYTNFMHT